MEVEPDFLRIPVLITLEAWIAQSSSNLRGAWRDLCFPAPFSWFLQETGLESLKITSARCFSLKCQRKDSKKAKEHRQFVASLGASVQPRSTVLFMPVSDVENGRLRSFFLGFGVVIWWGKAFRDQQYQFLTRNKSLSAAKMNQTVRWLLSACVPIRFCSGAPASSTVDVNSRFSRFQVSAFWSNGLASSVFIFAPILLRFFFIVFVYARAKICCYRFFNFDLRKKLCFVKADRVG